MTGTHGDQRSEARTARRRLRAGTPAFLVCALTLGLGLGLVVASVSAYAHWWAVGVVLLAAAHVLTASWLTRD